MGLLLSIVGFVAGTHILAPIVNASGTGVFGCGVVGFLSFTSLLGAATLEKDNLIGAGVTAAGLVAMYYAAGSYPMNSWYAMPGLVFIGSTAALSLGAAMATKP